MQSSILSSLFYEDLFIFYLLCLIEISSLYAFSLLCKCKWGKAARYDERSSGGENQSNQSRTIIRIICSLVLWMCTALCPCSARHLRISSFFSITSAVVKRSFAAGLPAARTLSSIRAWIQPFSLISFTSESQKEENVQDGLGKWVPRSQAHHCPCAVLYISLENQSRVTSKAKAAQSS